MIYLRFESGDTIYQTFGFLSHNGHVNSHVLTVNFPECVKTRGSRSMPVWFGKLKSNTATGSANIILLNVEL